jgi:hypothetical protein
MQDREQNRAAPIRLRAMENGCWQISQTATTGPPLQPPAASPTLVRFHAEWCSREQKLTDRTWDAGLVIWAPHMSHGTVFVITLTVRP